MLTVAVVGANSMDICTHEEADTRLIMYLLDAAEKGVKNIIIRTVDNDILTIVLGYFELITQNQENLSVCVGFGKGKDSLPFFDAIKGAENTSAFHRKAKLVAWEAWKYFPIVKE